MIKNRNTSPWKFFSSPILTKSITEIALYRFENSYHVMILGWVDFIILNEFMLGYGKFIQYDWIVSNISSLSIFLSLGGATCHASPVPFPLPPPIPILRLHDLVHVARHVGQHIGPQAVLISWPTPVWDVIRGKPTPLECGLQVIMQC